MSFAWPWMLLGLVAVPLLVLGYRRLRAAPCGPPGRAVRAGLVAGRPGIPWPAAAPRARARSWPP